MAADLTLRLEIYLPRRMVLTALTAGLFLGLANELASENVSLTTYYPAPSGVYSQMVTTGNTFLARDGGYVDVGNTVTPAAGSRPA